MNADRPKRLTVDERPHFGEFATFAGIKPPLMEPVMGTLDQRLGILVRRHGGRTQPLRTTDAERREYLEWLRRNDPEAANPFE